MFTPAAGRLTCSQAAGVRDRAEGMRWFLHFGGLLCALIAAGLTAALGAFAGRQLGFIAVLLCGLAYVLAGVDLARPLAWVGLLLLASAPGMLLLSRWQWTLAGAVLSLATAALGFTRRAVPGAPA